MEGTTWFSNRGFTESAREALAASQELVRRYQHSQWDIEHLLRTLLDQDEGVPAQVLRQLGIDVGAFKLRVEEGLENIAKLQYKATQVYQTPRSARLLENTRSEAERFKDEYIGTEHLFIGVTQERTGDSAQLLREFGVDTEKVYQALAFVHGAQRHVENPLSNRILGDEFGDGDHVIVDATKEVRN
jgi:ATP-dependent Clp protease ATP-binding subunit ClpC